MLIVRILAQVLAAGLPILVGILDYHWRDKRTRRFRRLKWALFGLAGLLLILGVVLTVQDDRSHAREVESLQRDLKALNSAITQQASEAQSRDRTTQGRLEQLLQGNQILQQRLAPFEHAANRLFPQLPPQSRLSRLEQELDRLSQRTRAVEARTAPRSLHAVARKNIRLLLSPFAGQALRIDALGGDAEAMQFAREISTCFSEAGLSLLSLPSAVITPDTWSGLILEVPSSAPAGYGDALASSLRLGGHSVRIVPAGGNLVILRVGAHE